MNKCIRLQIIKPTNASWDELGKVLRELNYQTYKILNKSIQLVWEWNNFSLDYKEKFGEYPNTEKILGYKSSNASCNYIYSKLKKETILNTANLSQTIKRAVDRYKNDRAEILRGNISVPSYKRNCPIDIVSSAIKLQKENNEYKMKLSLINTVYKKEQNLPGQFEVIIKVPDNTRRTILERILTKEYKICASQIINHKNKWFINLCFGFQKEKQRLEDKTLGVDLGINIVAYMAVNNSLARYYIPGGEIEHFRKSIEKRTKELQKQGKYCGKGREGHGTLTRIKPIEKLNDKASNFRNNINHKYSKYIVKLAIKNKCNTIQMEDLTNISKDNSFLKRWTYYDLQNKIEYKAEENGIKIIKIFPKYTSQRCNKCGYINKDNRKDQKHFECIKCGYKENADYNAAQNISIPKIEIEILKQVYNESELQDKNIEKNISIAEKLIEEEIKKPKITLDMSKKKINLLQSIYDNIKKNKKN